jgi:hypothetical protein
MSPAILKAPRSKSRGKTCSSLRSPGVFTQALDGAEVSHLFLKGATLDMLAYGSLALKRGRDIDILVEPRAAGRASHLLSGAGYARITPGPEIGPERFEQWVALCKESSWRHGASGLIVELHTGLVDNPDLLAGIGFDSPRQIVPVAPGIDLPTLATEELYAYLCVHGATHAWSRLKWIADVGAFLARPGTDIERLHANCEHIGAGRASAQALLLCGPSFRDSPSGTITATAGERPGHSLARPTSRSARWPGDTQKRSSTTRCSAPCRFICPISHWDGAGGSRPGNSHPSSTIAMIGWSTPCLDPCTSFIR